jgi:hypothetical protein
VRPSCIQFALEDLFSASGPSGVIRTAAFERIAGTTPTGQSYILDSFGAARSTSCCFLSVVSEANPIVRFVIPGIYGLDSCASGGWFLRPTEGELPTYWIPQPPIVRNFDQLGRILSEAPSAITAFKPGMTESSIELGTRVDANLEVALWRFPAEAAGLIRELEHPLVLERQPLFMLSSHTAVRGPADVYRYLVHGRIYENRFEWRRKRKICSELEAYAVYVALRGLQAATRKKIYSLLMRQILFSVIARQTVDGGWQHGEWTDFNESHYRFHSAAMALLESALEDMTDSDEHGDVTRSALARAAALLARCVDTTDIGLWFLHDSLEQSLEMTQQSGMRWIPSRILGKSATNKMILNTHLDAIVALDRYRELTGDRTYSTQTDSALGAARRLLALRPAELLYRIVYWAVGLTLLPSAEAAQLALPLRVARRLTRLYALPRLHRLKRRFPRIVMPGGLIERHLSRLHFGTNYHSVNVSDLARVWRRFPEEAFGPLLDQALSAVTETSLLRYWAETKQEQALGYWVEALFQLCTLRPERVYRRHLAEAMVAALDSGLGLPPSLLGAHPEIVPPGSLVPCPSPSDARLRVANLGRKGRRELLVVNPANTALELAWESHAANGLVWASADDRALSASELPLHVPARGWVLGREG